jgi:hypothetical protein
MPYDSISNTWVEQTLRVDEWTVWLQVIPKVNGDAVTASKSLDAFLGAEGIAGGPITRSEHLTIEATYWEEGNRVQEIADSDDEGEGMDLDIDEREEEDPLPRNSSPTSALAQGHSLQTLGVAQLFQVMQS